MTKFTPVHLEIFLCAYTKKENTYPDTVISNRCTQELIQQGLVYKQEDGSLHSTEYGNAKMKEILMYLNTPEQRNNKPFTV